nr:MAG TPA: hypothetical protein [Caudoviricetes sp.]
MVNHIQLKECKLSVLISLQRHLNTRLSILEVMISIQMNLLVQELFIISRLNRVNRLKLAQ